MHIRTLVAFIPTAVVVGVSIFYWRAHKPPTITSLSAAPISTDESRFSPPDYEKAFENLMKEEGGYSEDPDDPGGATKYGLSSRSYPHLNISSLTLATAKKIYRHDFWNPLHLQQFKAHAVASEVLEQSVHMGSKRAVTHLQTCVVGAGHPIQIDGQLGPTTINSLNKISPDTLVTCIKSQALGYYRDLTFRNAVFKKYLKGWFNRVLT